MDTDGSQNCNQWLLCQSKRYSGRTYFFNTLTGDAVWNLSQETVSFIKTRTNQSKAILNTGYPEPKEAFNDTISTSSNQLGPANMYTYCGQSPSIANINFSHCIPQNTYNNITLGVPMLNVHPNSLNWNETSKDSKCYLDPYQSNMEPHQSHVFYANSSSPISSTTQKGEHYTCPPKNKVRLQKQCDMNDQMNFQNNSHNINASHRGDNDVKVSKEVVEDDLHDIQQSNNFNISALQTLFKIDVRTKVWFLVLDEDVFLNNLNFIKEIRSSDNRCRLVVPECVLNRIQKGTTSVNKIHMKRALQAAIFISNVLTENCAIVDKENSHDDHIQNIVACYTKYSQKDYKVVLLTENNLNQNIKDVKSSIYRMEEVEYFMIYGELKETPPQKHNPQITITIPKNYPRKSVSIQTTTELKREPKSIHKTEGTENKTEMVLKRITDEQKLKESLRNPWNIYSPTNSNSYCNSPTNTSFNVTKNMDVDENVMFEIRSEAMQGNLVSKSEEWVSRFTQILEEVLNQVLQKAAFHTTPPPWTMYEACECIKRGFKNDADVVDAANKLGDIIFDNGALRGKINHNLNPSTFMKIYSYGVYLIDTLQGVFDDDDNLQTAEKLLAKLLLDIETPDTNNSFNEIDDAINEHNDEATPPKTPQNQHYNNRPSRITRSKARNIITSLTVQEQTNQSKVLQFLPGKDNFLSNFELKNVGSDENMETDNGNTKTDESDMRPKIIRNFTKMSKLEDKLDGNESDEGNLDFLLDGAEVPEMKDYTHLDFIEQTKAKLGYVFKFCQDTRQKLLNPQNLNKLDVNSQARNLARLINFCRLQLTGIYERKKYVYLNVLNFNEAEYNYNREFVKCCLDECAILNTALSIIITETN